MRGAGGSTWVCGRRSQRSRKQQQQQQQARAPRLPTHPPTHQHRGQPFFGARVTVVLQLSIHDAHCRTGGGRQEAQTREGLGREPLTWPGRKLTSCGQAPARLRPRLHPHPHPFCARRAPPRRPRARCARRRGLHTALWAASAPGRAPAVNERGQRAVRHDPRLGTGAASVRALPAPGCAAQAPPAPACGCPWPLLAPSLTAPWGLTGTRSSRASSRKSERCCCAQARTGGGASAGGRTGCQCGRQGW